METKYLDIAYDMRKNILTRHWKPNQRLPTREKLVKQYDTSKATMQKTINMLIDEGLLYSRNKKGTFISATPPNLYSIAVVFPINDFASGYETYTDSLWTSIMRQHQYLEEYFGKRFIFCRYYNSNSNSKEFQRIVQDATALRLSGIIFTNTPPQAAIQAMKPLHIPKVTMTTSEVPGFSRVHVDYSHFFSLAVKYLISQGCTRIALLTNPEISPERTTRCRQDAIEAGIKMPLEWELSVSPLHHAEYWVRNLVRLLFANSGSKRPDGLIIANENLHDHVIDALKRENIIPGRDIKVAVHHNFPTNRPLLPGIKRIGFDVRDIIKMCINAIEESELGNFNPPVKLVEAVYEDS